MIRQLLQPISVKSKPNVFDYFIRGCVVRMEGLYWLQALDAKAHERIYAQAGMEKKRDAQRRAVDVLLDRKPKNAADEWAKRVSSQIVPAKPLKFPEVAV
jgi:hypothetical protein